MEDTAPEAAALAPLLAVLGAVLCAAAVVVSAAGSPGNAAFGRGLLELLIVGMPIVAGVFALRAPGTARFGFVLVAIGFVWSLTALGQTSASVPYMAGRLADDPQRGLLERLHLGTQARRSVGHCWAAR